MSFLGFLFMMFAVTVGVTAFFIWHAWRKVKKFTRQFNPQDDTGFTQERQTSTKSGDTIVDTRSQEEVDRKIFSKDEGEYVDFKEK